MTTDTTPQPSIEARVEALMRALFESDDGNQATRTLYAYRTAPIDDPNAVLGAFEAVKDMIRATVLRALSEAGAQAQPSADGQRVHLVCTGEVYEGQETYTRHEGSPPPLCDFETLYTAAPALTPARLTDAQEREAFEAWCLRRAGPDGDTPGYPGERAFYFDEQRAAWVGWKARAILAAANTTEPASSAAAKGGDTA